MRTNDCQVELARLWNHLFSHDTVEEPEDIPCSWLCSSGIHDIRPNDGCMGSPKQHMAYMETASAVVERRLSYQYGMTTYRDNSTE